MARITINGYGAEIFAGTVDKETYDYFIENDIDLDEYASDVEFNYGNDRKIKVPEQYDFAVNGMTELDNVWHVYGGYLSDDNTIEILNDEGDTVWESNLDPDNLQEENVSLEVDGDYDDILDEMDKPSYIMMGERHEKGTIFDGEFELTGDFDHTKLTIIYHSNDGEFIIKQIQYNGEEIENTDSSSATNSSSYQWYEL